MAQAAQPRKVPDAVRRARTAPSPLDRRGGSPLHAFSLPTAGPAGPASRHVLHLQRTAGNAATTRLVRGQVSPLEASPLDLDPGTAGHPAEADVVVQRGDPEVEAESQVWSDVVGEFMAYSGEMAAANVRYPTVTRGRWLAAVEKLWAQAGDPGARSDAELEELRSAFLRVQDLFVDVNTEAFDLWFWLNDQYGAEKQDLLTSDWPEDHAAAEVLEELYLKTYDRMEAAGPHLVAEDLVAFHHMLTNGTHLERGAQIAAREAQQRAALEAEDAADDESEPSAAATAVGVAWDVVGWDSWGDFAGDVALTVVSGGVGKILKVVVKGRKAQKKLTKVKKLGQLRKARKVRRARKLKTGLAELARSVTKAVESGLSENAGWLRQNWKRSAQAYLTDELGVGLSGGSPGEAKTFLERVSKDRIQAYVDEHVVPSKDAEEKQFRSALLAAAAGLTRLSVGDLRRYFVMNLKRRGLGNSIYYSLRMGVLETPVKGGVAADLAASIAGDMLQDVVNQFGAGNVTTVWLESWRKALQNSVAAGLKDAFGAE